jgi:NAD(P)-dependent dehydrogenase (short-subunit alcohol dehydrogenase family)
MIKPIEERTVLVTGSTDGIGKRTARDLAARGATVLLHGRDPDKGARVREEIARATGSERLHYHNADLASLDEVRGLAREVGKGPLDVLINNAGIGTGPRGRERRQVSRDGYELRLAVNYLAPFLLTHLLLPALGRSAPARIVNVSSLGQEAVDLDDLMLERRYDGWTAYGRSKLALAMFTFELAGRLEGSGITVNALHPGSLLDTKMVREAFGQPRGDVQEGADAELYLATAPELEGVTGRFFDRRREARVHRQAYDTEVRRQLYQRSAELTGLDIADALRAVEVPIAR